MKTKKQADPGPSLPETAAASTGRKPWKKKTPVEVVVDQINKLRDEVAKDDEALKSKRSQLQKMEKAREIFESL